MWLVPTSLFAASDAWAADAGPHLDGRHLSLWWALPFAGLLLSIAVLPQLAPRLWHGHFGKITAGWALAFLAPFSLVFGVELAGTELLHTVLLEYLPFIILLYTLFVVAGGIRVSDTLVGTPSVNTSFLAFGTGLASVMGTTGAAMLLVRPLIQANINRRANAHVLIFFVFLVANIGGSLTPLGDPPLFLGFLQGVPFGWTATHLFGPMLLCSAILLAVFYVIDRRIWLRDGAPEFINRGHVEIAGLHNLTYLVGVVGAVLLSGMWKPGVVIPVWNLQLPAEGLVRDAILLGLAALSLSTTPTQLRVENTFTWEPIREVVFLFAGIFVTIIPVLRILRAGPEGALSGLVALVSHGDGIPNNTAYFWLTGALSSFLDNAPTYLVFFNLAGGDAQALTGHLAGTLLAISAGAVFMGANTYIGNAPNFMVRSIAVDRGVRMPSFFGYMLWSGAILLPLFVAVTFAFFRS